MSGRWVVSLLCGGLILGTLAPAAAAGGFRALATRDGLDLWAVGTGGTVFRSLDGGATWSSNPLGATTHRDVAARGSRVWIADSSGTLWMSRDAGGTFTVQAPAGAPLFAVEFVDDHVGWIAGAGGVILKTTDGGESWSPQVSGTAAAINALRFHGPLEGWGCGAGGTVLHTTDGGATWVATTPFAAHRDLYAVDWYGTTVYVAGTYAFLARSPDAGGSWTTIDLKITSMSDVNGLSLLPDGTLWLCGGGGFLWRTVDGGRSFTFPQHPIVTGMSDVLFLDDQHGWACAQRSRNVARTVDGGQTWSVPGGGGFSYSWAFKLSSGGETIRGNTLRIDPFNRDKLYAVQGKTVVASWDRGDHWSAIATIPGVGYRTNAFLVAPDDSNTWLALIQDGDRVTRTIDGGQNWTTVLSVLYSEYGVPMEQDASHPNEVYLAPEDGKIWKSTDFGKNWFVLSDPHFRSPDDISVVPDTNVIYVGDGVTGVGNGVVWKSPDGGLTWESKLTVTGSEIPMIAVSRHDRWIAYATNWPFPGVERTLDMGETWPLDRTTPAEWGADFAKDDPNVAMTAVYSGGASYITLDRGTTWQSAVVSGSNYGLIVYDRGTWLLHQSNGIWKAVINQPDMPADNTQFLTLLSPNGGEVWQYGQVEPVTWSYHNLSELKVELQTDPLAPWQTLAPQTPAWTGAWPWTIPDLPTQQARIRLSNVDNPAPVDQSDADFSIVVPYLSPSTDSLDFGSVAIGSAAAETLRVSNPGTATLVISSVTVAGGGPFVPTRTSFSIPAGSSDTLAVIFEPITSGAYEDTLLIAGNAPGSPERVALAGSGGGPIAVGPQGPRLPLDFAFNANVPNPFGSSGTVISYALPAASEVSLVVYNVLGQAVATLVRDRQPAGFYAVRFPGAALTSKGLASALSSGVYFCRLRAGSFSATRRLVLVR